MPYENPFVENLKRWSKLYPETAKPLSELNCVNSVFFTSNNNELNLKIKKHRTEKLLHSPKNPSEEAREWFASLHLERSNVLYVYGVGLGYYYKAAQEWLKNPKHFLIFLEDNLEVIHRLLETKLGSELIRDKQVRVFYFDSTKPEEELWSKLSSLFYRNDFQLTALSSYLEGNTNLLNQIHSRFSFWNHSKRNIAYEYDTFGKRFFENFYPNLSRLPCSYHGNRLFNKFQGVPAIICGAGPSLEKNLPLLETLKDRALIFAGGTAMNAVNTNGFLPHLGLGIDPNPSHATRLIMNTAFEVPFLYRARIHHQALSLVHGPLFYVNGSSGYQITNWIEEQLKIHGKNVSEGFNVVNFGLSLAYEMGCNPIIFVGMDLAYTNEQSYHRGIKSHPTQSFKENFSTRTAEEEVISSTDIYGKPISTLWKWLSESAWISHFAQNHPTALFINATEGGIGMPGIINMPLSIVFECYLTKQYDLDLRVHGEKENSYMPITVTTPHLIDLCHEIKNSLQISLNLCHQLQDIYGRATDLNLDTIQMLKRQLEAEIAYQYILRDFEKFYRERDLTKLQIEFEENLSMDERNDLEAKCEANLYRYLLNAVERNIEWIEMVNAEETETSQSTEEIKELDEEIEICLKKVARLEHHTEKHPSGAKKIEYTTLDGRLHGLYSFFSEAGRLLGKSFFINGLQQGKALLYYASGKLYAGKHYREGLLDGMQEYFYPSGLRKTVLNYTKGMLDGEIALYHRNGRLKRKIAFHQGKRHGLEQMWNEKGTLVLEAEYKDNNPVGYARTWHENGGLAKEVHHQAEGKLSSEKFAQEEHLKTIVSQTEKLSTSIEQMFNQLIKIIPHDVSEGQKEKDVRKDFSELLKEFQHLETIRKKMIDELDQKENETSI